MWYSLSFWILAVIIGTSFALEPSCPICSKYDFEEKLLERVIQNEFALKFSLDKITEIHTKVADTLKRIDEKQVTLNDVMLSLEAKKQNLEDKVDAFISSAVRNVSTVENQLNSTIQALVGQTSKALDVMREQSAIPLVMFHAHLSNANINASDEALVFRTILVNEGGGYNPNTGHFVASIAGVYMFTMQYCTNKDKWARVDIVKEGTPLQRSVDNGIGGTGCVSMQAFVKCAMGDKVWVRFTYSTSEVNQSDNFWNSFAGILIKV